MRILLYGINFAPEPVGIGKYTGELATWLGKQGRPVSVITAQPYFPSWRIGNGNKTVKNRYSFEYLSGAVVRRCPLWVPRRPSGITRLLHLASFALTSLPVLLAQRRWRPDVVNHGGAGLFLRSGGPAAAESVWQRVPGVVAHSGFRIGCGLRAGDAEGKMAAGAGGGLGATHSGEI